MKRKILRVGRSSLAVSLPKTFLNRTHLSARDEIDVEERGSSLIINSDHMISPTKIVNIEDLSLEVNLERTLDKIIGALFKQGNDSFSILCPSKEKADILRKIIKAGKLSMYEDPEITNNTIVNIRSSIIKLDENSLDNLTQVIVKQIYSIFEDFSEYIKNKKLNTQVIEKLVNRDRIINDHSDICRRIINKNVKDYRSTTLYSFINILEKLGDAVRDLISKSLIHQKSLLKHYDVIEKIKLLFYNFFLSSKHFSIKRISVFYQEIYTIEKSIEKIGDQIVYHYYMLMIVLMSDAYSDLMMRNL